MTRFRVTIRGDETELRGYATIEALTALTAPPGEQPYVIAVSPTDDDYNPFGADATLAVLKAYIKANKDDSDGMVDASDLLAIIDGQFEHPMPYDEEEFHGE